jgi:lysophospholipase L1-like esterase
MSFIFNIFFLCFAVVFIDSKGGYKWVMEKVLNLFNHQPKIGYAENKIDIFGKLPPIGKQDIVFLGDSILDYGEWHEWLGEHAKNRAINGDDTGTVLNRLHGITAGRPRHIVLLIGLANLENNTPLDTTRSEYAEILSTIRKESPDTDIWLLSLTPVNRALYQRHIIPGHEGINMPEFEEVRKLNIFIEQLASQKVHYINMAELLSPTKELSSDYTLDGEHLNGAGLKIIAQKVKKLILHQYAPSSSNP